MSELHDSTPDVPDPKAIAPRDATPKWDLATEDLFPTRFSGRDEVLLTQPLEADPDRDEVSTPRGDEEKDDVGRYVLCNKVGDGGMGIVYRAHDALLNRDLALKVMSPAACGDPELLERFIEEAQVTGQLQHPGVPPVFERGTLPDGRLYFTMKLVKGETLAYLLGERPNPGVGLPRFLEIFEQVAQAVAYAHSKHVIHRDLKPANVMVGAFGEVQVMDWGLAKVLGRDEASTAADQPILSVVRTVRTEGDSGTKSGRVAGTPAYMPPEQALGLLEQIDERTDVFALGSILCQVLTSKPAYVGRSSDEVYLKAARADITDVLGRLNDCGADGELVDLARRCLAPERLERPRNAGEVAESVAGYRLAVRERLKAAELARVEAQARAEEEAKRRVLADDLTREAQARAAEERRRRRMALALATAVLALVVVGGGSGMGYALQRLARQARIEERLQRAESVLTVAERSDTDNPAPWEQARIALSQADESADGQDFAAPRLRNLRNRIALADKFRGLVADLEIVRSDRAVHWDARRADTEFAAAFRRFGSNLDAENLDVASAGRSLAGRPSSVEIAAALDAWAGLRRSDLMASDPASWRHLVDVARMADPDPWRNQLRDLLGRPREAASALNRLAVDPEILARQPAASMVLLSTALKGAGQRGRAADVLRTTWRRYPADFWVNYELGISSIAGAGEQGTSGNGEAVRFLTAAIVARPGSSAAYSNLGATLRVLGRLDEAVACHREAIRLKPDVAEVYINLGDALRAQQKLDEAIAAFRVAIRLRSDIALAHLNLGFALNARGRSAEAEAAFREAIRLKPDDVPAYINLGIALNAQNKLGEAAAAFREAIRLKPDIAEIHMNLGNVLNAQGEPAHAAAAFREAIRLKPDSALAHVNLGNVLWIQGKLGEAAAAFREVVRLKPDGVENHVNLGNILSSQGKHVEAAGAFREAIRLKPDFAEVYAALGTALCAQGRFDEAAGAFREAIRLKPEIASAHFNLGAILCAQGKTAEAVAACREATRLKPDFAEAYYVLGITLRRRGEFAPALDALHTAHELGSKLPGWPFPSAEWVRRSEEIVIQADQFQSFLDGDKQSEDAAEGIALADIASAKELFAASARFYAGAFAVEPKRAEGREIQDRYMAACSAALAGCGRGKDDPPPDEATRARLREQALEWLKADLVTWSAIFRDGPPRFRDMVRPTLSQWQTDPNLEVIREAEALEKLPEAERVAWRTLWEEVADLLKKTEIAE